MAGEARLDGDLRGFEIANFADHHHIRILSQDRAQAARKAHLDLHVDLRLGNAVDQVLDRILHRHDVAAAVVQARERGVQRGGLARAGWSGDEENPVRPMDDAVEPGRGLRIHADLFEFEAPRLFVEQAQYHTLAVAAGNGRDADVYRAVSHFQRNAPVLRQALLCDVELRHDLDARDDQRPDGHRRLHDFAHHAIHPQADGKPLLEGLDVNVRRALNDRLTEQRVDEPDDGRIVGAFEQVGRFVQFAGQCAQIERAVQIRHHFVGARSVLLVGGLQPAVEVAPLEPREVHVPAQMPL